MALKTNSLFYFGINISEDNNRLDIIEGGIELNCQLSFGNFTFDQIASEIASALNDAGSNTYTAIFDRATRLITISSTGIFDILPQSGIFAGSSAWAILGFPIDASGLTAYTGDYATGSAYATQFPIQNYLPTSANSKSVDGAVKKSASGVIEAVRFGLERRMECEIFMITNIFQPPNCPVRSNDSGFEDAVQFLEFAVTKGFVEFMPDETKPEDFQVLILESTEFDQNGLGFKLIEEYDKSMPEYFRTGKLVWLLQETN